MMLFIISLELSIAKTKVYLPLILSVLGLELILSLVCLLIYTVRISRFNRSQPGPDINQEDRMQEGWISQNIINLETGFREGSRLEEIVEKQADLIEYLKLHNAQLSKRLLSLTSQQIRD
ncbi:transmembrane protein 192 [Protopterus annectens]|uniref:transmembrane protein 192 n=1 Tax=Protopterus annectens TaxID=7888 RepID=UPI001CFBF2CC|nr:transmembrane protein 192 [Protopterus annectens]